MDIRNFGKKSKSKPHRTVDRRKGFRRQHQISSQDAHSMGKRRTVLSCALEINTANTRPYAHPISLNASRFIGYAVRSNVARSSEIFVTTTRPEDESNNAFNENGRSVF